MSLNESVDYYRHFYGYIMSGNMHIKDDDLKLILYDWRYNLKCKESRKYTYKCRNRKKYTKSSPIK